MMRPTGIFESVLQILKDLYYLADALYTCIRKEFRRKNSVVQYRRKDE